MEIITTSTKETKQLAAKIANTLKPGDVLALYGDLGSGKTNFTSALVESLGIKARVQSPTFVIMRNYTGGASKIKQVHHIDLYRLTELYEALDLGIGEMMQDEDALTIIEWPELLESVLPESTKRIYFEYVDEYSRKIKYGV